MAQSKQQIQAHLAAAGSQPRHRFGQNFMIDQNLIRLIADAADIAPGDTIIEVGPGTGTLTDELLSRGTRVVAVEIDRDLAGHLRNLFGEREAFQLIEGDALDGKHALNPEMLAVIEAANASPAAPGSDANGESSAASAVKLVANLPYNIASPLVIELLLAGVETLVFTVQKEVADRLAGRADSDDYGPLTVMASLLSHVKVLRTLPPQAFWPAPKISSALVRMDRDDRLGPIARDFGRFVQRVFSFRRKTLRKALDMMDVELTTSFEQLGMDPSLRAEMFTPEQMLGLFRVVQAK
jgi:16S rRNA (adenine1518-N6/adenine1519-N6)-dimethyltransferase